MMINNIQNHLSLQIIPKKFSLDIFLPLRRRLNNIEVSNQEFAYFICQLIPAKCAFERDIKIFGRIFHIPALCKLNPLYNEVVSLRLRALDYLATECGEDIQKYIA